MPNIEIYGLNAYHRGKEEFDLAKRIHQLFKDKPYADEVVVTIFSGPTCVIDRNGDNQPFLRLINSADAPNNKEIIALLQTLGMDIEHIPEVGFYPSNKKNAKKEVKSVSLPCLRPVPLRSHSSREGADLRGND